MRGGGGGTGSIFPSSARSLLAYRRACSMSSEACKCSACRSCYGPARLPCWPPAFHQWPRGSPTLCLATPGLLFCPASPWPSARTAVPHCSPSLFRPGQLPPTFKTQPKAPFSKAPGDSLTPCSLAPGRGDLPLWPHSSSLEGLSHYCHCPLASSSTTIT